MILGGKRHERAAITKERKERDYNENYAQVIAKQFGIVEGKIT